MTLRNWSLVRSSPVYASIRDRWLAMLEDEVLRRERNSFREHRRKYIIREKGGHGWPPR